MRHSDEHSPLTIGMVGLGAVGTLLTHHWRKHACYNASGASGYKGTITRILNTSTAQHSLTLPAWQGEALDWLVLTTKAAYTLPALHALPHSVAQVKRILLLQNGMGQHDQVMQWLRDHSMACELWLGSTTEGAFKQDAFKQGGFVTYAGKGQTHIGRYPTDSSTHIAPPDALPSTCLYCDDIVLLLREKLAINAVINPISAYKKCLNGELATNTDTLITVKALCGEITQLYQALGWPLRFELCDRVLSVAVATANNRSSTLQDVLANRPTELDYICGYLLTHAKHAGVELPITRELSAPFLQTTP